jgi:hypothetical protein
MSLAGWPKADETPAAGATAMPEALFMQIAGQREFG